MKPASLAFLMMEQHIEVIEGMLEQMMEHMMLEHERD
jgi:hypothetical protein